MMVVSLRRGLLAGLIAGLLVAILLFVDNGPGTSLEGPAYWLALEHQGTTGKLLGFLIMVILGGVFGLLFGALQRQQAIHLGRSLGLGLITGALCWLVVVFFIGMVINHVRLDFGSWLFTFTPLMVYGMLLGSIYKQTEHNNTVTGLPMDTI